MRTTTLQFLVPLAAWCLGVSAPGVRGDSPAKGAPVGQSEATGAGAQKADAENWVSLFDGTTMTGWKSTAFGGGGGAEVEKGALIVDQGEELSGVNCTAEFPKMSYELELEAQRRSGLDFFCGITFPVRDKFLSFIIGGWGGSTVGISSVDKKDASMNETTSTRFFKDDRWYKVRLRVEESRIQAWIDDERVVDLDTRGKELSLRTGEIDLSAPIGIASFRTTAAYKGMRVRRLSPAGGN